MNIFNDFMFTTYTVLLVCTVMHSSLKIALCTRKDSTPLFPLKNNCLLSPSPLPRAWMAQEPCWIYILFDINLHTYWFTIYSFTVAPLFSTECLTGKQIFIQHTFFTRMSEPWSLEYSTKPPYILFNSFNTYLTSHNVSS